MPKPKLKQKTTAGVVEVMVNEVAIIPGMEFIEVATGLPFVVQCIAAWAYSPDKACVVLRPRMAIDDNAFLVAVDADDLSNAEAWLLMGF